MIYHFKQLLDVATLVAKQICNYPELLSIRVRKGQDPVFNFDVFSVKVNMGFDLILQSAEIRFFAWGKLDREEIWSLDKLGILPKLSEGKALASENGQKKAPIFLEKMYPKPVPTQFHGSQGIFKDPTSLRRSKFKLNFIR